MPISIRSAQYLRRLIPPFGRLDQIDKLTGELAVFILAGVELCDNEADSLFAFQEDFESLLYLFEPESRLMRDIDGREIILVDDVDVEVDEDIVDFAFQGL